MCITAKNSKMTSTIVGGNVNYKKRTHTLLYKNNVQNLAGEANALILPIMGSKIVKVTDTTSFNTFMDEIVAQTKSVSRSGKSIPKGGSKSVQVYQVGAYTIIQAENATSEAVMSAIKTLPEGQRPEISLELLWWYKEYYKNPILLICCFTGADTLTAQPIMVEYIPRNFDSFLVPGADSHDGTIPNMGSETDRDHTLIFGQYKKPILVMGSTVKFSKLPPEQFQNSIWDSSVIPNVGTNCDWVYVKDPTSFNWMLQEVTTKQQLQTLF